ncbi:MAG: hypothetical protein KY475_00995 [Planctomycetes bacterium]|nr:hypothetical protein [Planctomycetota bacterium]
MTKERFVELISQEPFRPFTVRIDGKELRVENWSMAMFHPAVAEVFVVTREGAHEFLPENVQLLTAHGAIVSG